MEKGGSSDIIPGFDIQWLANKRELWLLLLDPR